MERLAHLALCAVVCCGLACGAAPPSTPLTDGEPPPVAAYLSRSCAREGRSGPLPERGARQGSTVALARDGEGLIAYVADRDRDRVVTIDVTGGAVLSATPLLGSPEQLVILGDGRVAVAIGSASHLEIFEPSTDPRAPLARLCARPVPAGPFGLALSPDERTLAVTSAWEPALTSFDMTLAERGRTPLARAPRGVLVDARDRAFVTHLAGGTLSVVSLDRPLDSPYPINLGVRAGSSAGREASILAMRRGSQAFSLASVDVLPPRGPLDREGPVEPRLVVPMVSVDPGGPDRTADLYYGPSPIAGVSKAAPVAVVVDPIQRVSLTTHVVATTGGERAGACSLPRAVAAHPRGARIYVACDGIDELLELDARAADPMRVVRRRFPVASGPTGVAVAAREDLAVVFSQFDAALTVVPLGNRELITIRLKGGVSRLSAAAERGRRTFYRSDDLRITHDGMACSSCHPDGTDDGLTWFTPDGPRQTIMLAGRLSGTAPYGWTRAERDIEDYIQDTCRRLGGRGLSKADLADLASYVKELPRPPGTRVTRSALVAKGGAVFTDRGCTTCHRGTAGTDGRAHRLDRWEKEPIDTPSLRSVGKTAPYFHDGRYDTLEELLGDKESRMGATAKLSPPEREALRAYLESL